jgi:hypothetical protein
MTDPADVTRRGKSTWTRLRAKEKQEERTQRWFFRADSPEDDDEDVMMRYPEELRGEIEHHLRWNHQRGPSQARCERQQWTVYINPTEIQGDQVGVRDYVIEELARDIGDKCPHNGCMTLHVEVNYTCFHVTLVDGELKEARRIQQCRVACVALLGVRHRLARNNTPQAASYNLVARLLWNDYRTSERWDGIPHWKTSVARTGKKQRKL